MIDNRYDNRPRLNYAFANFQEPRLTAGAKSSRPRRTGSEPRGTKASTAFVASGKAGKELTERKRTISEAESLLAAALRAMG